ncbi:McrB family protein [Streptomyces showdoensis]|uniref:GTPase subunit of restriction endonuclease n=1 Tax=Streptomyces showdoensis TaxID=68268 RepID=A0A2P2GWK1_STREW|nr:AAA family ATPase [Streptomyces showdoensis]KKZ75828.1 GTPase subunit of restriction endonuclease [Streptomyces showdoensis]
MADTGEQYAVTVGGRPYELMPSGGWVILPLHGSKIHHDPSCGHLTDSGALPRYPDPDGLLWRRLLDADDVTAFAEGAQLLNGKGRPVTGVCSCALRPVTESYAADLEYWPVDEALRVFDRDRYLDAVEAAERDAAAIRAAFPWEEWPTLPVERYALGQPGAPGPVYSHVLEYGSKALGSITGGSAMKHLLYRRSDGTWWYDKGHGSLDEAWEAIRSGVVAAVTAAREGRLRDIDDLPAVRSGITVIAKTLRVYAPEATLPVYADSFTQHYLDRLAPGTGTKLQPFARKEALKRLIDADPRFQDWPPQLVWYFLDWWAPVRRTAGRVVRIGLPDAGRWDRFRGEGYIAVDADRIGDLHGYADLDEFKAAYAEAFAGTGHPAERAADLWQLPELRLGDRVVATSGRSEVLGVGKVTDGYRWRADLPDHRHTVDVVWDGTCAGGLDQPVAEWAGRTVTEVPPALWRRIQKLSATPGSAGDGVAANGTAPAGGGSEAQEIPPLEDDLQRIDDALERRGQAVLFGPPGTGKTYHALRYAVRRLGELSDDLPGVDPLAEPGSAAFRETLDALTGSGRLTMVAFHPSYGYEDFVEGLRPVDGAEGLALRPAPGVFKRVCARAAENPGRLHLVIVDELNRGNLPRILGELITILEKDKRGLPVTLPLTGEAFRVPPNVRILGTMNTADRSIRMLDAAIRRRFSFLELLPDSRPLVDRWVGKLHLADFLDELNRRIRSLLDREKQIGHAFFLPGGRPVSSPAEFAAVIRGEILPLLQEYAYDDYTLLAGFLGDGLVDPATHTLKDVGDEPLVTLLYEELQVGAGAE